MSFRGLITTLVKSLVVSIFFMGVFSRCAKIMTPQGGPKDTIPPVVTVMTPENYMTNFTEKRILIEFDEFVQLKNQQTEFFVSPLMSRKPLLSIRGRGILVTIRDDSLKDSTTYALNFGSTIADNNEGNPLNSFRYVFSTGDEIDSIITSGYTVDAYAADSVSKTFLYFYPLDSLDVGEGYDSTLFNRQPTVIGRAENNGIFIAQNLKPIDYKIYAFEDTNSNQAYEAGVDKVGFLDSIVNPITLPDFGIWYDSTRNYVVADPQLYFRLFTDESFKRHVLQESKRTLQHKVELFFGAPYPEISQISIDSIPDESIIIEPLTKGLDTLNLWINLPPEQIPDSARGYVNYLKHDSLGVLVPTVDTLRLNWKYVESSAERDRRETNEKGRERAERRGEEWVDEQAPNPFKSKLTSGGEVNPLNSLIIDFDYPIIRLDTAAITLTSTPVDKKEGAIISEKSERFSITRDSVNLRRYYIDPVWGGITSKYKLTIPEGAIENLARQSNDSIKAEYTLLNPEKHAMVIINLRGRDTLSAPNYIVELLDGNNKRIESKSSNANDKITFEYVKAGDIRIRVVEDRNYNHLWDTGNLVQMRQAERVEQYVSEGESTFTTKENWDMELDIDISKMFAPITMNSIVSQLEEQEIERLKLIEEKRAESKMKANEKSSSSSSGFGMSSLTGAVGGF